MRNGGCAADDALVGAVLALRRMMPTGMPARKLQLLRALLLGGEWADS